MNVTIRRAILGDKPALAELNAFVQDFHVANNPTYFKPTTHQDVVTWFRGLLERGFTALVTVGGVPDLSRIPSYCAQYPDRVCSMLKERNVDTSVPAAAWVHDARIKAAVVAAPTLAFTFAAPTLAPIKVPIQLWRAANDQITPHPRAAEAIYSALPIRPAYVVVPHAGHFVFVACSAELTKRAPAVCQDVPEFDREAFHRELNAAIVTFFKTQLPRP